MTTLEFLGIYTETIEKFTTLCEKALGSAGFSVNEVDEAYDWLHDDFKNGFINNSDFTNSLIRSFASTTITMLEERFPNEEFDYSINGYDNHLI